MINLFPYDIPDADLDAISARKPTKADIQFLVTALRRTRAHRDRFSLLILRAIALLATSQAAIAKEVVAYLVKLEP